MSSILRNFSVVKRYKDIFSVSIRRNYSAKNFEPFYESFFRHSNNTAVIDTQGAYKYKDILAASLIIAKKIKQLFPECKENGERISFLCTSDATYASVFLACWITGNAAVPLCTSHPAAMLEYYVEDSESKLIIANEKFIDPMQNIASKLNASFLCVDRDVLASSKNTSDLSQSEFFSWDSSFQDKRALIIYTSGTTGRPKGVVLTHSNLFYQISAVNESWEITSKDSILHSLPLHHIHGIMNAFLCPLKAGGTLVMQPKFNAVEAWEHFLRTDSTKANVNLFFAVPTMYAKLIQEFDKSAYNENSSKEKCSKNMRLMSSGSSSLPVPVFHRWENITGHTLLERFGMSEIGMATSNPLKGKRIPGCVGNPLPKVEVKILKPGGSLGSELVVGDDKGINILPGGESEPGELLIRGPNVFKEYYNREKGTREAFTEDGWFQTGDTACYEKGSFKILGRTSVDIIKSGGFKISALEVESCLLRHPDIKECTVLGLEDDVWGERVAAVLILNAGKTIENEDLRTWCKQHIPVYSVPTIIKHVDEIPRNVMGKVNKKELRKNFGDL